MANDLTMTLLRAKIYEPDVRVEELFEGDVEAILIFLRNTGFGPEMTINVTDPVTKKPFQTTVMLDELSIISKVKNQTMMVLLYSSFTKITINN